jgi:hypothetical protein
VPFDVQGHVQQDLCIPRIFITGGPGLHQPVTRGRKREQAAGAPCARTSFRRRTLPVARPVIRHFRLNTADLSLVWTALNCDG